MKGFKETKFQAIKFSLKKPLEFSSHSSSPSSSKERLMSRRIIVKLVQEDRTVNLAVKSDDGVDLAAVGSAFGLVPATVRLNGHFLGSSGGGGGPRRHVSSVTWHSLLRFFSSRGFPAGDSFPIAVLGKPSAAAAEDADHLSFKRKIALEDESPAKKNCISINDYGTQQVGNATVSDDETISIGKRLKLDDDQPSKKPKIGNHSSGLTGKASKLPKVTSRFGFTYNCAYRVWENG